MSYDPKLTADGLITLLAALIAFFAVMRQIRASSLETTRQLKARDVERRGIEQSERQALAVALLYEIDHFYRSFLGKSFILSEGVKGKVVKGDITLALGGPVPADVFRGTISEIGTLGPHPAGVVIRFYSVAWELTDLWQRYSASIKQGDPGGVSHSILSTIEGFSTNLRLGALEATIWLCLSAGIAPEILDLKVIADRTEIEKLAELKGLPLVLPPK